MYNIFIIIQYAEQSLAKETGMEVVIIRPPLAYGPGVKGNFISMVKWMAKPVPLPFGSIYNKRSFIALDNLVNFISLCIDRESSSKAVNQIFLISDDKDVSTTQLLEMVGDALRSRSPSSPRAWLFPFPSYIMTFFARALGKHDIANRLFGSLQIDSSKARNLLGWTPIINMDEQLTKMLKDT